jgi:hypothetical protein
MRKTKNMLDMLNKTKLAEESQKQYSNPTPWWDIKFSKEVINHLWDIVDLQQGPNPRGVQSSLAGNISKSSYLQDKENWFYKNVLKEMSEAYYCKHWDNYYDIIVSKSKPMPKFQLNQLWANFQKQHEFNPPHNHAGSYSFVIFMKIPTHWKEQHALPICKTSTAPSASNFQFIQALPGNPVVDLCDIPLSPEDEGRMLFFPAWLTHQVFPFYGTEEERITLSGNIIIQSSEEQHSLKEKEAALAEMENQIKSFKEVIKQEKKIGGTAPQIDLVDKERFRST